jgi:hypothetical protein
MHAQSSPHADPFVHDAKRLGVALPVFAKYARYSAYTNRHFPATNATRQQTVAMSQMWAPALGCTQFQDQLARLLEAYEHKEGAERWDLGLIGVDAADLYRESNRCMLFATPLIRARRTLPCFPVIDGLVESFQK